MDIETLLREHSVDEIEVFRDNLSTEIAKRTEQLKSIAKKKYIDIVKSSDLLKDMKEFLKTINSSQNEFYQNINSFYSFMKESSHNRLEQPTRDSLYLASNEEKNASKDILDCLNEIWDRLDVEDLKLAYDMVLKGFNLIRIHEASDSTQGNQISCLKYSVQRAEEMIINKVLFKLENASPDSLGLICNEEDDDLFKLSMSNSLKKISSEFDLQSCDMSFHAQFLRHQSHSYFDLSSGKVESITTGCPPINSVMIPDRISPELGNYLTNSIRNIKLIIGINLRPHAMKVSLELCLTDIFNSYTKLSRILKNENVTFKKQRSMQVYFDLIYLENLIELTKDVSLIEELESKIKHLTEIYESFIDSVELYTISSSVRVNVTKYCANTWRLRGLLVPHLQ